MENGKSMWIKKEKKLCHFSPQIPLLKYVKYEAKFIIQIEKKSLFILVHQCI